MMYDEVGGRGERKCKKLGRVDRVRLSAYRGASTGLGRILIESSLMLELMCAHFQR